MSEFYDFDGYDELFEVRVETHTRTYDGDRGQYGVPESPDFTVARYQIESVVILGVDITDAFDTSELFDEDDDGEMTKHIADVIREKFDIPEEK